MNLLIADRACLTCGKLKPMSRRGMTTGGSGGEGERDLSGSGGGANRGRGVG